MKSLMTGSYSLRINCILLLMHHYIYHLYVSFIDEVDSRVVKMSELLWNPCVPNDHDVSYVRISVHHTVCGPLTAYTAP